MEIQNRKQTPMAKTADSLQRGAEICSTQDPRTTSSPNPAQGSAWPPAPQAPGSSSSNSHPSSTTQAQESSRNPQGRRAATGDALQYSQSGAGMRAKHNSSKNENLSLRNAFRIAICRSTSNASPGTTGAFRGALVHVEGASALHQPLALSGFCKLKSAKRVTAPGACATTRSCAASSPRPFLLFPCGPLGACMPDETNEILVGQLILAPMVMCQNTQHWAWSTSCFQDQKADVQPMHQCHILS